MFRRTTPGALRAVTGRVLAHAAASDGATLAITDHAFVTVTPGQEPVVTPWHTIRAGEWDRESMTLSWRTEEGSCAAALEADAPDFVRAFHERVGASVVLARVLQAPGGSVSVAVRKDLATRELFEQMDVTGDVDLDAPAVAAAVGAARRDLRDQVGLSL